VRVREREPHSEPEVDVARLLDLGLGKEGVVELEERLDRLLLPTGLVVVVEVVVVVPAATSRLFTERARTRQLWPILPAWFRREKRTLVLLSWRYWTTLSVFSMSGIFSSRPLRRWVRLSSMYRYLLKEGVDVS
jgi:hypothetical protein